MIFIFLLCGDPYRYFWLQIHHALRAKDWEVAFDWFFLLSRLSTIIYLLLPFFSQARKNLSFFYTILLSSIRLYLLVVSCVRY